MAQLSDIEALVPGFAKLTKEERDAIQLFTLFWALFESRVLNNNFSHSQIKKKVFGLNFKEIGTDWFSSPLEYFRERYIDQGKPNGSFYGLRFRGKDNAETVQQILTGENDNPNEQLLACLIIVYRYRNNLFHGYKWENELQGQFENFTHATELLKNYLTHSNIPQS